MAPSSTIIRAFRLEDFARVIELYDRISIKNPHFLKNEASLSHFMNYLNVNRGNAFITEEDGKLTGFAIVSIDVELGGLKQGSIIEIQCEDMPSMRLLIQAALDHCRLNDVDSIVAVPPALSRSNEFFKDWLKFDTGVMMAKPLSPEPWLRALLSNERTRSLYAGRKIAFHIGTDVVNAEITPSEVHFLQTSWKQGKAFAQVFMSPEVFLKLILGQLNPYTAYLNRKVKIKGVKNTLPLLKLLYLMRVNATFSTTLADRM